MFTLVHVLHPHMLISFLLGYEARTLKCFSEMLVIEIIIWFYNPGAEFYSCYINLFRGYNIRDYVLLLFYITAGARRVSYVHKIIATELYNSNMGVLTSIQLFSYYISLPIVSKFQLCLLYFIFDNPGYRLLAVGKSYHKTQYFIKE